MVGVSGGATLPGMNVPKPLVELFVYGVFDGAGVTGPDGPTWPGATGQIAEIQASEFNVVTLSTFHVNPDGSLYGSEPLVANGIYNPDDKMNPDLPQMYQGLAAAGKTLLYSIGNAAGTTNDMNALQSIFAGPTGPTSAYASLQQNMGVLQSELAISGIDFDFEPGEYGQEQQQVVTEFTTFCNDLGFFVTYCPFTEESFWIGSQIDAVNAGGSVAWWNLQCYGSGGGGNTPGEWAAPIGPTTAAAMNVDDVGTFIAGSAQVNDNTPSGVQQQFSQFAAGLTAFNGGFLWQFGDVVDGGGPLGPWATAIEAGTGATASV